MSLVLLKSGAINPGPTEEGDPGLARTGLEPRDQNGPVRYHLYLNPDVDSLVEVGRSGQGRIGKPCLYVSKKVEGANPTTDLWKNQVSNQPYAVTSEV